MALCDEHLPISQRSLGCRRAYYREATARYRLRHPRRQRDSDLRARYGISYEQYDELLAKQGGVCAICHGPEPAAGKSLAVDHDHNTGEVRGILCSFCNTAIGKFRDSPELLERAKQYLIERGR